MVYILAAGAGMFLVLFLLSTHFAVRRRNRILQLEKLLAERESRIREAEERIEGKNRQVEQFSSQAERAREEARKAKKKTHELETRGRESRPSEDAELDRIQEETLHQARSQAGLAREEASRAAEECGRLREQVEQLKKELKETQATLSARREKDTQGQQEGVQQLKQLQDENRDLNKKLQAAKRKARTDSQVYKVTKSKLDLAMEKIQMLEKNAKSPDVSTAARQSQ